VLSIAEALGPADKRLALPLVLDHPVDLLKAWVLKRARGASDSLLQSTAWGLIEDFEALTAERLPGLRETQGFGFLTPRSSKTRSKSFLRKSRSSSA
jgi:hypothetical protein